MLCAPIDGPLTIELNLVSASVASSSASFMYALLLLYDDLNDVSSDALGQFNWKVHQAVTD
jgi:hypothetical protein